MADRLLSQFQVAVDEDVYRIGQYTPVSIRDQIVRATYLVQRLMDAGKVKHDTQLVIVGAGAAGVTAAINATDRTGKPVVLVDLEDRTLSLQGQCHSRWLDPVQYDWPAQHWNTGEWPIAETPIRTQTALDYDAPTTLNPDYATGWSAQFQAVLEPYLLARDIAFLAHTEAESWTPLKTGGYRVRLRQLGSASTAYLRADVLIWAGGFGAERCTLPMPGRPHDFRGIHFWETDAFEDADFGIARRTHPILVSGAGDGALQDFIRLVSGLQSARAVWDVVAPHLSSPQRASLVALWHWDETARRLGKSAPDGATRCEWQRRLHRRYADIVNGVAAPQWANVSNALAAVIGKRAVSDIFLAVKHDHFDVCYPLNRAIALILARHVREKAGHSPVLFDTAIKSTRHVGPTDCAQGCWGRVHEVELVTAGCATSPGNIQALTSTPPPQLYSGLVIRHGIDPLEIPGLVPSLHPQEVPAHLP